jgi:ComF family protein
VSGLGGGLFAVFFPDQCRLCRRRLRDFTRVPVCADCLDSIQPDDSTLVCPRCGREFNSNPSGAPAAGCSRCLHAAPPFDRVHSFAIYRGGLRQLIHLFKYERMLPLARPLADKMRPALARFGPIDLVVPVPLYWTRRWARGFNQSALLARRLAGHNKLAFQPRALRRIRRTEAQAGLSDVQRVENVRGAFAAPDSLVGRRVLLVDDVMTTGATLAAAAQALRAAGAAYVGALTLARAVRGTPSAEGPVECS